jgi:hypothetical protein
MMLSSTRPVLEATNRTVRPISETKRIRRRNGGTTVSVQHGSSYLGLGEEGDEVGVDGGLLPRRLPAAALPFPPHPVPLDASIRLRRRPSANRTDSGGCSFPEMAVGVTWSAGFCGLEEGNVLDSFRLRDWSKTFFFDTDWSKT